MESRLRGMLGIATKAGKVIFGYESIHDRLERGKETLVLMTPGISERSKKDALSMCRYFGAECYEVSFERLIENACGKAGIYLVGITGKGFVQGIRKIFEETLGGLN